MATYRLEAKIIKGSSGGGGAVASAAYRAGERYKDDYNERHFDYQKRKDVVHSEIIAPKDAPEWATDRERLWNEVTKFETGKRYDAQLAREILLTLPNELSPKENVDLVREFVKEHYVSKGMIADVNIHHPKNNPHAHVMLTLRRLTKEGWNPAKATEWNRRDLIMKWREGWAEKQNEYLASAGYDIRVDHRSLADRGIHLIPQKKIGIPLHMRNKEKLTFKIDEFKEDLKKNGNLIISNPSIALAVISDNQATFSDKDIYRFLNGHTLDGAQMKEGYDAIVNHPDTFYIADNDKGEAVFTTKRILKIEASVIDNTRNLIARSGFSVPDELKERAIASVNLYDEQVKAVDHISESGALSIVLGRPGTGKSFTMRAVREMYESAGYEVRGVSVSATAVKNLEDETGIRSRTIYSQFKAWDKERDGLTSKSVLVVDEAGFVSSRQSGRLMNEVVSSGAKIVFVGDEKQLPSIEFGGWFNRLVNEASEKAVLKDVHRQSNKWQREQTVKMTKGVASFKEAINNYLDAEKIIPMQSIGDAKEALVSDFIESYTENESSFSSMIAFRNKDVAELNDMARVALKEQGYLQGDERLFNTVKGRAGFVVGDSVLFLRNEMSEMKVRNGSRGWVSKIDGSSLSVALDDGRAVKIDARFYDDFTHGYATTTYKFQGPSTDNSFILMDRFMNRNSTLVALSRHKEDFTAYYPEQAREPGKKWSFFSFDDRKDLVDWCSRDGSKSMAADFADSKGLDFRDLQPEQQKFELKQRHRDQTGKNLRFAAVGDEGVRGFFSDYIVDHKTGVEYGYMTTIKDHYFVSPQDALKLREGQVISFNGKHFENDDRRYVGRESWSSFDNPKEVTMDQKQITPVDFEGMRSEYRDRYGIDAVEAQSGETIRGTYLGVYEGKDAEFHRIRVREGKDDTRIDYLVQKAGEQDRIAGDLSKYERVVSDGRNIVKEGLIKDQDRQLGRQISHDRDQGRSL